MKWNKAHLTGFLLAAMILLLSQIACCGLSNRAFGNSEESPLKKDPDAARAFEIQRSFGNIYELYKDRVVFISTEKTVKLPPHPFFNDPLFRQFFGLPGKGRQKKHMGLGTGFILSEDGYICTNHHLVANMDRVLVKVGGKTYTATVVGSDARTDIALLKIAPKEKLKAVYLGNSDEVRVGDWSIAIGNPSGLDRTFTVGVISATGRRDVDFMGGHQAHIQTDASINPGNSGGPLINIRGEVIGINRMIYSRSGGSMGIGFAIPINTAKTVLAQLKKYRKVRRGFIGVSLMPVTEESAQHYGWKSLEGALVAEVIYGGPAQQGGVLTGDIVAKMDGVDIKSYRDFLEKVGKAEVGTTIKITVWRNRKYENLDVRVMERP